MALTLNQKRARRHAVNLRQLAVRRCPVSHALDRVAKSEVEFFDSEAM
jgi:hypothetical protein